jgi:hypothetical protein
MNALKRVLVQLDRRETAATPAACERSRTIPRPCTLDAFTEALAESEGISLPDLEPLTTLVVQTTHSVYRMTVVHDTTVLLRGGAFPVETMARLHGSGFGGYLLRLGWIGVGLRMEFSVDGKRFITSTVRAITTGCDAARLKPCAMNPLHSGSAGL